MSGPYQKNNTTPIEWETVRRKPVPKTMYNNPSAGGGGSNENSKIIDDVNENYVPRAIRDSLDEILKLSESIQSKNQMLKTKIYEFVRHKKSRDIDWEKRLKTYIIHRVCKTNKQEILSAMISKQEDIPKYVNAISSTKSGNTCLFDAVYYGSDQCINVLLNRGADIRHVNKAGETIYDLLETGRKDYITRYPDTAIFINERYDDCLRLIKMADEERTLREAVPSSGPNAGPDTSPVPIIKSETESSEEVCKFGKIYDEQSLKEDFTTYIEKENTQEFKDFIHHIKETLHLNDLLKTILEDEDIQGLFEDNPYAKALC
jgi:hypothetical protein